MANSNPVAGFLHIVDDLIMSGLTRRLLLLELRLNLFGEFLDEGEGFPGILLLIFREFLQVLLGLL